MMHGGFQQTALADKMVILRGAHERKRKLRLGFQFFSK